MDYLFPATLLHGVTLGGEGPMLLVPSALQFPNFSLPLTQRSIGLEMLAGHVAFGVAARG